MGEISEIKELLKTTIEAMNSNIKFQQDMISQLQEDNRLLRNQLNNVLINQIPSIASQSPTNIQTNQSNIQSNTYCEYPIQHDPLKAEVINKFKRNKKRIIKKKILETIKSETLSIPEIKEIIVDQYKYCSKASFYRYIEELKTHDFIHINKNIVKIKPLVEVI